MTSWVESPIPILPPPPRLTGVIFDCVVGIGDDMFKQLWNLLLSLRSVNSCSIRQFTHQLIIFNLCRLNFMLYLGWFCEKPEVFF